MYLHRAVGKAGNTVDFRLSDRRVAAAKAFFKKAIRHQGHAPHTIALDGYAASHRAVREIQHADMLPKSTKLRSSMYLNKLVAKCRVCTTNIMRPCQAKRIPLRKRSQFPQMLTDVQVSDAPE